MGCRTAGIRLGDLHRRPINAAAPATKEDEHVRIAVVGTGIAGLTCVELLRRRHDVTVFEADTRPGGHTNTVAVSLPDADLQVDTGFLVYTERAYPLLTRLFRRLGTPTQPADMSFSVRDETTGVEWRGTSPATVFAQPANAARPAFWRMLVDVARFNRACRSVLERGSEPDGLVLRELVARGRWSAEFVDGYLVPIGSSIWSADPGRFLDMPVATFAAFFDRHGLLRFGDQAPWRTVTGGARRYVDAILAAPQAEGRLHLGTPVVKLRRDGDQVELLTGAGAARFDHVVVAAHADQALGMLGDPTTAERDVLGALRYQANRAVLHTDASLLPRRKRARASWNYHVLADRPPAATLTYDITRLQQLPTATPVLVTLNREDAIDPATVLAAFDYAHPVCDAAAVAARRRHAELNDAGAATGDDRGRVWYCGAYWGDGFHEDGARSAVAVCRRLGGEEL